MPNFIDYLGWRGDLSFNERPFNEVDNLIFAELAYADLNGIVPAGGESVTLADACAAYLAAGRDQSAMINDPKPLLEAAARSRRFGGVGLSRWAEALNAEEAFQFAAVCFELEDGAHCVAYRGTDNTIAGWREDFNLSYMPEVPAQRRAAEYLDAVAAETEGALWVVGHSKGGNLALYAAAFCGEDAFHRIKKVYSNDGPGFNETVAASEGVARTMTKALQIIPEASLVGVLLDTPDARRVVKSGANGVLQHNPYSWEVMGTAFVEAPRSGSSRFMDATLSQWLGGLNDAQRANLTGAVFDALSASGAETIDELNTNRRASAGAIVRAVSGMDPAVQKDVLETLRKLADAGREQLVSDARKGLNQFIEALRKDGE